LGDDRTPGDAEKTFDLTLTVADSSDEGAKMYWLVEERGRGAWPWPERFGVVQADAAWQADRDLLPSLWYDLGDTQSAIPLVLPVLVSPQPLAAGASWEDAAGWTHEVQESVEQDGRQAWRVQASNAYGPKRVMLVAEGGALAVGYEERVFMGMGQEFLLQLNLVGQETLAEEKLQAVAAGYDALLALRGKLDRTERTPDHDWNDAQLALLAEELPAIEEAAAAAGLAKLVRAARKDVEAQSSRASAVDELVAQYIGEPAAEFEAEGTSREKVAPADLQGRVTVLHFWEYREPLQEPYGQVGYLEFAFTRWKEAGVQVYGVAVDSRLDDESTRSTALRGVKKLKQFMNLSYPVLLDGGAIVKKFGDPRVAGAELPLWVVVGPDGNIAHYHVGFYDVDRNEGLKALDAVVQEALGAGE
jgi:hypothetical protein